jgi:predicted ATP-dependent serine protease
MDFVPDSFPEVEELILSALRDFAVVPDLSIAARWQGVYLKSRKGQTQVVLHPQPGVTMVTALASICTGRAVRARVAMTGEITLRGKVLPIGGVKEKVLAARRAGVLEVILPQHNKNDLVDIPEVLRRDLTFHYVDTVPQVLALALAPPSAPPTPAPPPAVPPLPPG